MTVRRRAALLALLVAAACKRPLPPSIGAVEAGVADAAAPPHATAPDATAEPPRVGPPGVYMGRTIAAPMSYRGADWLDREGREAVQQPEHVLDVLGVAEGQTVADVGCGSGFFTTRLSRRVGPRGRVIATDLQEEMLALLRKKLAAERITNVSPALATADDAALPPGVVDLVLLVDVYHELPNPPVTLAQVRRSLARGGRLVLVEYRAEDPKVAIKPEHKTTLVQLKRELEANGWRMLSNDESLPEQRIVVWVPIG